jgi:hypothetical protein
MSSTRLAGKRQMLTPCNLLTQEYGDLEERFYKMINFRPSYNDPTIRITEPSPSVVINLNFLESKDYEWFEEQFLVAFRTLAKQGHEKLYVFDWQHNGYEFYPMLNRPPLSVYPDGDYYSFVAEDFSFWTFGHPWQHTVCIFGKPLIDALPETFWKNVVILRQN